MNPTLCEGDILEAASVPFERLRPGDVVLFRPPGHREVLAHRISRRFRGGFRTRGDNCDAEDLWSLGRKEILGKVERTWRRKDVRPVAGGRTGLRRGRLMHLRRRLMRRLAPLLRILSRTRSLAGPLLPFAPPALRPRLVRYGTGSRAILRIQVGRHSVGRYDGGRREWVLRHPWRLVVTGTLPCPALSHRTGEDRSDLG